MKERSYGWHTSFCLGEHCVGNLNTSALKEFGVGNLTRNSQTYEKQNRENTRQRKIITCTRQYLRGLTICLCPQSCRDLTIIKEKNTKSDSTIFSLSKTTTTNLITNVRTYVFYMLRIYVMILCNWFILWQNALYLYLGRLRMCLNTSRNHVSRSSVETFKYV